MSVKAISKLRKIKMVLNSVISRCQSAFVQDRNLLDRVFVANEVVNYAKKG